MSRRPFLVLASLLAVLGLAACGGDGGEDVDTILLKTFGEDKAIKSGRLDLGVRIDAKGLQTLNGPVSLRLSGPFDSSRSGELPRFDFEAALEGAGQRLNAGAVSTGEKGFVRFQDQAYAVPDALFADFRKGYADQARCTEQRDERSGATFSALGVDPQRWLEDPQEAGTEDAGGVESTHITAGVNVPRFLEDVNRVLARAPTAQNVDPCAEEAAAGDRPEPRRLTEEDREEIADAIKTARLDVWTGAEDRILRRLNVEIGFEVPEANRQRANGLTGGTVRFDMTLGALNREQKIAAPGDSRPLADLLAQFGGTLPGLGGAGSGGGSESGSSSGGGSGSGAGGAGGATGTGSDAYQRCAQEAGQDVAKLQACADLIGR